MIGQAVRAANYEGQVRRLSTHCTCVREEVKRRLTLVRTRFLQAHTHRGVKKQKVSSSPFSELQLLFTAITSLSRGIRGRRLLPQLPITNVISIKVQPIMYFSFLTIFIHYVKFHMIQNRRESKRKHSTLSAHN